MQNNLGFKFRTHYAPTIGNYVRHVCGPIVIEEESPAEEVNERQFLGKKPLEALGLKTA